MKRYLIQLGAASLLLLWGCQPAIVPSFQSVRQSSNPLGTEGQIILSLQIDAQTQAQQPAFTPLPRASDGFADASGLPFRLLAADRVLAEGQVEGNQIVLAPAQLANTQGPYKLELQLPHQQLASTLIRQALIPGAPIPVTFRETVIQSCEGDGCVNVGGSVSNQVDHVDTAGGSVCVGICTQAPKSSGH